MALDLVILGRNIERVYLSHLSAIQRWATTFASLAMIAVTRRKKSTRSIRRGKRTRMMNALTAEMSVVGAIAADAAARTRCR